MVTIDGEQYLTLQEAASRLHINYDAMHKWLSRHKEVPRKKISRMYFVRFEDLAGHNRRVRSK